MALLISRCTEIMIRHAKPQGIVKQDGNFAGGGSDRLLLAYPREKPAIEGAQGGIATSDCCGRQSQ